MATAKDLPYLPFLNAVVLRHIEMGMSFFSVVNILKLDMNKFELQYQGAWSGFILTGCQSLQPAQVRTMNLWARRRQ